MTRRTADEIPLVPFLSRRSVAEFLRAICRPGQGPLGVHGRHCSGERNTFEKTIVLMERRARSSKEMIGEQYLHQKGRLTIRRFLPRAESHTTGHFLRCAMYRLSISAYHLRVSA